MSNLQADLTNSGYSGLINLNIVRGTMYTTGTPSASCKVPTLYPCDTALTNLAKVAGLTGKLAWNNAVILGKTGNFRERLYIYDGSALDFTEADDVAAIRKKLIDWAHADGLYPPYTSVAYPKGGETVIRGRSSNITWDTANLGGNAKIELYKGGVLNATLSASVTNSGSYAWAIPAGQTVGSDYKIRVTPLSAPTKFDESNANFTIRNALTTVTYPNGGQSFNIYNSTNITWAPDGVVDSIRIDLYKGGTQHLAITAGTTNSGTYAWAIPDNLVVGTNYKVRVSPVNDASAADLSDANFSIRSALTTVTYPNGGQSFNAYNSPNITWVPDAVPGNVKIELYKGGALNSTINADVTNSGAYVWAIPDALAVGSDYKIMVTPLTNVTAGDLSDTNFTIRSPQLAVTYPNGGESLNIGNSTNITWQHDSVPGHCKVELFKGGSLYVTITASTTNSGSFSWIVPANQSYGWDYTVRVTPLTDPSAADESNAAFSVIPARQVFYSRDMNSNPVWQYGTNWGFGKPTGANQDGVGNADPSSGFTGTNVIGYNLLGDYGANLSTTNWVTTTPINCSSNSGVVLQFRRWLGIETPLYDHVYIEASTNGSTWVRIWENTATVNDAVWTLCTYDISAVADYQPTVYIRWGLGKTDSSYNYCGWNIDDVQLLGLPPATSNWTPYSWLAAYGITNNQAVNELLDPDNDGMPTWMEYQAGTHPNDARSVFSVFDVGQIAGTNTITWYGTTNSGLYTDFIIDRCTDLVTRAWIPVGTNSRSATGTNVWTDSNPPATGPAYYRPRLR